MPYFLEYRQPFPPQKGETEVRWGNPCVEALEAKDETDAIGKARRILKAFPIFVEGEDDPHYREPVDFWFRRGDRVKTIDLRLLK